MLKHSRSALEIDFSRQTLDFTALLCLFSFFFIKQTGEKTNVAVKTCKDCSPDVMEKFMSEAGRY